MDAHFSRKGLSPAARPFFAYRCLRRIVQRNVTSNARPRPRPNAGPPPPRQPAAPQSIYVVRLFQQESASSVLPITEGRRSPQLRYVTQESAAGACSKEYERRRENAVSCHARQQLNRPSRRRDAHGCQRAAKFRTVRCPPRAAAARHADNLPCRPACHEMKESVIPAGTMHCRQPGHKKNSRMPPVNSKCIVIQGRKGRQPAVAGQPTTVSQHAKNHPLECHTQKYARHRKKRNQKNSPSAYTATKATHHMREDREVRPRRSGSWQCEEHAPCGNGRATVRQPGM